MQKTVFWRAKAYLLQPKTYMFRKIKIAHLLLIYAARRVPTAFLSCTRVLEKFVTTGKKFSNFANMVLK